MTDGGMFLRVNLNAMGAGVILGSVVPDYATFIGAAMVFTALLMFVLRSRL